MISNETKNERKIKKIVEIGNKIYFTTKNKKEKVIRKNITIEGRQIITSSCRDRRIMLQDHKKKIYVHTHFAYAQEIF
jgi:uncharacterized pyridoxamine 5'-phosphate oxidase family protein